MTTDITSRLCNLLVAESYIKRVAIVALFPKKDCWSDLLSTWSPVQTSLELRRF